jgi:hypothetical protein
MVDSVRKYGVNIEQVFTATPPEPVIPRLIPAIVAPCMEILESTTASGAANASALLSSPYVQQGVSLDFTDLPAPRGNVDTLVFQPSTITADILVGGKFKRLSPTEGFLDSHSKASRAAFIWKKAAWNNIASKKLILAFDQHVVANAAKDVEIVITTAAGEGITEVITQINAAVGETVAHEISHDFGVGAAPAILIASNTFGAKSSVTIRRWGDNEDLDLEAVNFRVVGSGLCASDDADLDTLSPWIQFVGGSTYKDVDDEIVDVAAFGSELVVDALRGVRILDEGTTPTVTAAAAEDWTDFDLFAATALKSGDLFYADGVAIGQVTKVEQTRFRLGAVDSVNSTYDAEGNPIRQVYVPVEVNTMAAGTPFAPANAWFQARSLSGTEINEAASVESDVADDAAETASFDSNDDPGTPSIGHTLTLTVTEDGVEGEEQTLIWTVKYDTRADLQAEFADLCAVQGVFSNIVCTVVGDVLTFSTVKEGSSQTILIGPGTSNAVLGLTAGDSFDGVDAAITDLSGETLKFCLDNNLDKVFEVSFISDSLVEAVATINDAVGASIASISSDDRLVITSVLKGRASQIKLIIVPDPSVGFIVGVTNGSGRPSPDFSVNTLLSTVTLNPQIVRNSVTGAPLNIDGAPCYFSYEALRTEVAAPVTDIAITVSNFTELASNFGPIDERNPLGLGLFFALNAAGEGTVIKGVGIGAISAEEPKGTVAAYLDAFSTLRGEECYFVVPYSGVKEVVDAADIHVTDMSSPASRGERVLLSCPPNATRESDTVVLSGSTAQTTGEPSQLDLNDNPGDELVINGVNPAQAIPFELADTRQLYVEFTLDGVVRRYSVSRVSGAILTLRSTVPAGKNLDGFYTETVFNESAAGISFSLKIRGKSLNIPGTTSLDKLRYAEALRDIAQQYANRRHLRLYPDTVSTVINGEDKNVSSFFFGCALAGAASSDNASTPFSGRPVVGFTAVVGPRLQETQYDIVSAGNAVIEAPVAGGNLALRMQCTTDVSTIEKREWSITKAIDAFAKLTRSALKTRTGPYNISKSYLDETTLVLTAIADAAVESGLLEYAKLESLQQDPTEKTTTGAVFVIKPFYAANYINVTIFS